MGLPATPLSSDIGAAIGGQTAYRLSTHGAHSTVVSATKLFSDQNLLRPTGAATIASIDGIPRNSTGGLRARGKPKG